MEDSTPEVVGIRDDGRFRLQTLAGSFIWKPSLFGKSDSMARRLVLLASLKRK